MKTTKLLAILLLFTAFTISCNKDDDEDPIENHVRHDGQNYEMSHGMLELYGWWWEEDTESFNIDLTLLSPNVNDSLMLINPQEPGDLFYLEMFSATETDLDPGTYAFDAEETMVAFTFDYGVLVKNATSQNPDGNHIEVIDGTVTIGMEENNYEITIECTGTDDNPITGYYYGPLTVYQMEAIEAKSSNRGTKRLR